MPFTYQRTVRFQDTDAAGVVYFANILTICHEAYEASLAASGIDLKQFFRDAEMAVPITHAHVDFFRPLYCGDRLTISVMPKQMSDSEFEIDYEIFLEEQLNKAASKAQTRHVCINPSIRSRTTLSPKLNEWLQTYAALGA
jgi:1,4-dihydroxy-2-naphthoyl-CoA hydrolase